jgi:hypothetical protein
MGILALFAFLISLQKFSSSLAFCHGLLSFLKTPKSKVKLTDAVLMRGNCRHLLSSSQSRSQYSHGRGMHFSSTSSSEVDVMETQRTRSNYTAVKRTYETYRWKDKYNINFRVEGPMGGRPILLVHGFGANVVSDLRAEREECCLQLLSTRLSLHT